MFPRNATRRYVRVNNSDMYVHIATIDVYLTTANQHFARDVNSDRERELSEPIVRNIQQTGSSDSNNGAFFLQYRIAGAASTCHKHV